jgi:hypothetical protein
VAVGSNHAGPTTGDVVSTSLRRQLERPHLGRPSQTHRDDEVAAYDRHPPVDPTGRRSLPDHPAGAHRERQDASLQRCREGQVVDDRDATGRVPIDLCVPKDTAGSAVQGHDLTGHGARLPPEVGGLIGRKGVRGIERSHHHPAPRPSGGREHTAEGAGQHLPSDR